MSKQKCRIPWNCYGMRKHGQSIHAKLAEVILGDCKRSAEIKKRIMEQTAFEMIMARQAGKLN